MPAFTSVRSGFGRGRRIPAGAWPGWRSSQAALTWKQVPTANTFMSVDPELRADINPSYPSQAPWHGSGGHAALLNAWCSLVPNQNDGRLTGGPGGGHGDLAAGYQVSIDLMQEAPAWSLLSKPSGALPASGFVYNDGAESTGLFAADGRVRGNHNYNNIIHLPGTTKLFMAVVGAMYPAGSMTGPAKSWYFDTETGAQSDAFDYSGVAGITNGGGTEAEGAGVCYDSTRNCIWHIRKSGGGGTKMLRINLADGSMQACGLQDTWVSGYARLHYVPEKDVVVLLDASGTQFLLFNPNTYAWTRNPASTGSRATGYVGTGGGGNGWVPSFGQFLLWHNTSNTTQFTTLTPPASGSVYTGTWTWGVLSPSASNTVTPPAAIGGAGGDGPIMGRLGYLPALKGFYQQVNAGADLYFFATE